jgi:hypothetical protein
MIVDARFIAFYTTAAQVAAALIAFVVLAFIFERARFGAYVSRHANRMVLAGVLTLLVVIVTSNVGALLRRQHDLTEMEPDNGCGHSRLLRRSAYLLAYYRSALPD